MQEDQPQKDTSPAAPVDGSSESAQVPQSETPATPAHEEAQAVSGQDPTPDEDNQVVEGDEEPPARTDEDPGDDNDVPNDAAPEEVSEQSVEADQDDQHGQGV